MNFEQIKHLFLGMEVSIPTYAVHYNPALWPDPEKFDPTRFDRSNRGKNHPMSWLPFGIGPRNCVAMRLALETVNVTVIRLLRELRFTKGSMSSFPPKIQDGFAPTPEPGFQIGIEIRETQKHTFY